jgi:hypothetical protein
MISARKPAAAVLAIAFALSSRAIGATDRLDGAWASSIAALQYVSASGDGVALARATGALHDPHYTGPRAPIVKVDANRGLMRLCYESPGNGECGYTIDVRTADAGTPPDAPAANITDSPIGLTLSELLAQLHADRHLWSKTLVEGSAGTVVLVAAHDVLGIDNCNSGQCEVVNRIDESQLYFLADGVVAAFARQTQGWRG